VLCGSGAGICARFWRRLRLQDGVQSILLTRRAKKNPARSSGQPGRNPACRVRMISGVRCVTFSLRCSADAAEIFCSTSTPQAAGESGPMHRCRHRCPRSARSEAVGRSASNDALTPLSSAIPFSHSGGLTVHRDSSLLPRGPAHKCASPCGLTVFDRSLPVV
jgi:hypothetical protein